MFLYICNVSNRLIIANSMQKIEFDVTDTHHINVDISFNENLHTRCHPCASADISFIKIAIFETFYEQFN